MRQPAGRFHQLQQDASGFAEVLERYPRSRGIAAGRDIDRELRDFPVLGVDKWISVQGRRLVPALGLAIVAIHRLGEGRNEEPGGIAVRLSLEAWVEIRSVEFLYEGLRRRLRRRFGTAQSGHDPATHKESAAQCPGGQVSLLLVYARKVVRSVPE